MTTARLRVAAVAASAALIGLSAAPASAQTASAQTASAQTATQVVQGPTAAQCPGSLDELVAGRSLVASVDVDSVMPRSVSGAASRSFMVGGTVAKVYSGDAASDDAVEFIYVAPAGVTLSENAAYVVFLDRLNGRLVADECGVRPASMQLDDDLSSLLGEEQPVPGVDAPTYEQVDDGTAPSLASAVTPGLVVAGIGVIGFVATSIVSRLIARRRAEGA